ncbi:hypothetical protein [Streptococcus zalophi]|uniref:hypothetical protein n=1 Tax=Streptococcus zalophi TaxID=640031 RepID=UPI00215C5B09|nr:hypothetical protein [Streptococcus zalophi]MCR8967653.1 hypothetical protein [Streptococcus zalophi]
MWADLNNGDKEKYKTLITNFASLSEAFSQKAENTDDDSKNDYVAPIINSKFQETVFQKAFGAVAEDIANTSYDASLMIDDKHKYLVGIKSFGVNSGDQKVAQFKKNSQDWSKDFTQIKFNAKISKNKEDADERNHSLYEKLALEISQLRNQRIASSKAQIKGFHFDDISVESVYHVLMPSVKGQLPQIFVGETSYLPIDLENLEILGATNLNNPTNFKFTDGNHVYKYTAADSQLYMTFNNRKIVVDTWDVTYVEDPFYLFENLHKISQTTEENNIEKTVSWVIANKKLEVESSSGFNAFNGGSKLSRQNNYREKRINDLIKKYNPFLPQNKIQMIKQSLEKLLIERYRTSDETKNMRLIRQEFMKKVDELNNPELTDDIKKLVYRDANELYIPIPDSFNFHQSHPDFFGTSIGTFKTDKKGVLALEKEKRKFTLKFLPSGDEIEAYINQENGKAIQSFNTQSILGEWILRGVFQLKDREPLTYDKLVDLQINGIRLTKYKNSPVIGIEFIWIDINNPPKDAIGWVSKQ